MWAQRQICACPSAHALETDTDAIYRPLARATSGVALSPAGSVRRRARPHSQYRRGGTGSNHDSGIVG